MHSIAAHTLTARGCQPRGVFSGAARRSSVAGHGTQTTESEERSGRARGHPAHRRVLPRGARVRGWRRICARPEAHVAAADGRGRGRPSRCGATGVHARRSVPAARSPRRRESWRELRPRALPQRSLRAPALSPVAQVTRPRRVMRRGWSAGRSVYTPRRASALTRRGDGGRRDYSRRAWRMSLTTADATADAAPRTHHSRMVVRHLRVFATGADGVGVGGAVGVAFAGVTAGAAGACGASGAGACNAMHDGGRSRRGMYEKQEGLFSTPPARTDTRLHWLGPSGSGR